MRKLRRQQLQERVATQLVGPLRDVCGVVGAAGAGSLRNQVLLLCADSRSAATWRNVASSSICFCSSAADRALPACVEPCRGSVRAPRSRWRALTAAADARATSRSRAATSAAHTARSCSRRRIQDRYHCQRAVSISLRISRVPCSRAAMMRASASVRTSSAARKSSDACASTRLASSYSRCRKIDRRLCTETKWPHVRAPPTKTQRR